MLGSGCGCPPASRPSLSLSTSLKPLYPTNSRAPVPGSPGSVGSKLQDGRVCAGPLLETLVEFHLVPSGPSTDVAAWSEPEPELR